MFTSISIQNFRCFSNKLAIESLDRVNLITGVNDVGKTALLEAIFLLIGEMNIPLVAKISAFRGIENLKGDVASLRDLLWGLLFSNLDGKGTIEIIGTLDTGKQHIVKLEIVAGTSARLAIGDDSVQETGPRADGLLGQALQLHYTDPTGETRVAEMLIDEKGIRVEPVPPGPSLPGFFLAARHRTTPQEDAERFGRLEEMIQGPYDLLETLRIIEPRLRRLRTIFRAGTPMIWGDIGLSRMLPLPLMGDGLGRLTSILLMIANASHGVVLVDEVENGLHHSVMERVWQAIGDAARRFDVQVFATTHSFECIRAAHQAFDTSGSYDFRLHRLERIDDDIEIFTYDQEVLAAAMQADMEVR